MKSAVNIQNPGIKQVRSGQTGATHAGWTAENLAELILSKLAREGEKRSSYCRGKYSRINVHHGEPYLQQRTDKNLLIARTA